MGSWEGYWWEEEGDRCQHWLQTDGTMEGMALLWKEAKSGTVVGYGYFRSWGYAVG